MAQVKIRIGDLVLNEKVVLLSETQQGGKGLVSMS